VAPVPDEQTVLIQLDYLKAKNVAARGTVTFTPPRFKLAPDMIVTSAPCEVIVEAGEAEVRLIPSSAGTFAVTEELDGVPAVTWHINLPVELAGQTRSLFSFAEVQPIVQGVAVNTFLSGSGAPASNLGIDGDYYMDVPGKFWYGPKALGAWPAGFSVVGPAGTNGTNGTNGTDGEDGDPGPPGAPGTRIRVVQEHITSGNVALPDSLGQWRKPGDMSGPTPTGLPADFTIEVPAAEGDWVECAVQAMRTETSSAFLDVAVQKGSELVRYLSTDSATPPLEGDPGWYAGSYVHQTGPRGFYATAADIDGSVVRFVMANLSTGQGTMYASPDYHFIWSARNLGPAPA
jgi:hypothetical protein